MLITVDTDNIIHIESGLGSIFIDAKDTSGNELNSNVYLEGELKGNTPILLTSLKKGTYSIEVRKSGYQTETKKITIVEGATTVLEFVQVKAVKVNIKTIDSITQEEVTGVNFYLNDVLIGQTPLTTYLSTGWHKIKIEKEGYRTITKYISVGYGPEQDMSIPIPPIITEKKKIKIYYVTDTQNNILSDVEVYYACLSSLAFQYAGKTPTDTTSYLEIEVLKRNVCWIRFKKEGYKEKEIQIQIGEEDVEVKNVVLEPVS